METVIVYPQTKEESKAVKAFLKAMSMKFERKEVQKPYNPEFVAKIERAEKNYKKGNYITLDTNNIWESILSE